MSTWYQGRMGSFITIDHRARTQDPCPVVLGLLTVRRVDSSWLGNCRYEALLGTERTSQLTGVILVPNLPALYAATIPNYDPSALVSGFHWPITFTTPKNHPKGNERVRK